MKLQVLEDTTSNVSCYFTDRPVTCSGLVYDTTGSLIGTVSGTLGVSTTVSGDCGISSTDQGSWLKLTSVSSLVVNHTYRVENQSGQHEFVKLLKIPATTRICQVDQTLEYDYTTGDSFVDPEVKVTLTSDLVDDCGTNYRVNFIGLLDTGEREYHDVVFDVVAHILDQPITSRNLRNYDPGLATQQLSEERGLDFEDLLSIAWECVYNDLTSQGIVGNHVMNNDQLAQLQLLKFKWLLKNNAISTNPDPQLIEGARYFDTQYQKLLTNTLSKLSWVDSDQDLSPTDSEENTGRKRIFIL